MSTQYEMMQQIERLTDERDTLRRALEVIAVGDSKNPVVDAGDELVALGFWRAEAVAAVRAAEGAQCALVWRPFTENPGRTGRYIVSHRGAVGGDAYFVLPADASTNKSDMLPAGWSQMPDWKPTHWCEAPSERKIPVSDALKALRLEIWLSGVMGCRKNTDRQRTAAMILHDDFSTLEVSGG